MNQNRLYFPPPANWQDFQALLAEIAKVKYNTDSVQEFGRNGQAQDGVDVYAVDLSGRKIGIQCKETKADELSGKTVEAEIENAKEFRPKLDTFIIATTLRTDAKIQKAINGINEGKSCPFSVQIWFWDDINGDINRSTSVMASSYRSIITTFGLNEIRQHLSAISRAFDRPAFRDDFTFERNYNDFETALIGLKSMFKTGFIHDRISGEVVSQIIPCSMIGDKEYQSFIVSIERLLETTYQAYIVDKRKERKNKKQLSERAGDYNIMRRKLMDELNKRLKSEEMPELQVYY